MYGIMMFYVGAVLLVVGMWMLGKAEAKSTGAVSALVGAIGFLMAMNNQFKAVTMADNYATANVLLFAFTYLLLAINCFLGWDGRALGWFCLFVAIVTVPNAILVLPADWRFTVIWLLWGFLWFLFFLLLALGKQGIAKFTAYLTIIIGTITAWIPGYLILVERW